MSLAGRIDARALTVSGVSRGIDRIGFTFDDETLLADAGLIVPATLMLRLGLEPS